MTNIHIDPITNDDELRLKKFCLWELEAFWRIPGVVVMPPEIYAACRELESLTRQQIEEYEAKHATDNHT